MSVVTNSTMPSDIASERASEMIEFRCTRCWQSNFAECELTGNTTSCRNCGHETTVPEATPERIARAQAMLQEGIPAVNPYAPTLTDRTLSDREIIALADQATRVPLRDINFSGYSLASIWARLFAQLIDGDRCLNGRGSRNRYREAFIWDGIVKRQLVAAILVKFNLSIPIRKSAVHHPPIDQE